VAIEPLADRFLAEIPWSDLRDAEELYSRPAEDYIEALEGRVDLLVSINVLDHCFDMPTIMGNVRRYLKPNGLALVSFDKHARADKLHPLSLTETTCAQIFVDSGLVVEQFTSGMGRALNGSQTYGHGPYTLNYWLRANS
jgi:hypothetical protein